MSSEVLGVSLTIAATVISVYNTVLFYRQSRLVEKQTLLERSQVYPYLRIRDMNVKQNMFKLTLENKGESPAFARARKVGKKGFMYSVGGGVRYTSNFVNGTSFSPNQQKVYLVNFRVINMTSPFEIQVKGVET